MLARISEDDQKANTRQKIKLGGLVIKAGLGDENEAVILALRNLYGTNPISMQQLSATFRRGDLIDRL
jgi:hypothetical protein